MSYKVFMKYYKMNIFKRLGINTLGELQEFVQWFNKYWKGRKIAGKLILIEMMKENYLKHITV